ncbi:MAG: hypothetical protein QF603_02820, partial [Alphaproteobacteria bacterium]|nr:hypothetical protein [Alphaproteobacteria bacterium]
MTMFTQDFSEPGSDTIADFDPAQDTIDFRIVGSGNDISNFTITASNGGTLIDAGGGATLFIEGVIPDQLGASNVTLDGQALTVGPSGTDLGSIFNDLTAGNVLELPEIVANPGVDGGGGADTNDGDPDTLTV